MTLPPVMEGLAEPFTPTLVMVLPLLMLMLFTGTMPLPVDRECMFSSQQNELHTGDTIQADEHKSMPVQLTARMKMLKHGSMQAEHERP